MSPPYDKALVIAGTLGCSPEDLFAEDDLPAADDPTPPVVKGK